MVDKLRLEVILSAVDKVTGPLNKIIKGSKATAAAMGEAELAIKKMEAQQRKIQRLQDAAPQLHRQREVLSVMKQSLDELRASGTASVRQIAAQEMALAKQTAAYERQKTAVLSLRSEINAMGLGNATQAQQNLAASITATNAKLAAQRSQLEQQQKIEERLARLREKHGQQLARLAMAGGAGAGLQMAGAKARVPLQAALNAFMPAEVAQTQLKIAFMQADGSVAPELGQIVDLATRLGDKLPGTTADFIDMMTVLRKEGMSAQAVLGGLGESAANLAVLLGSTPQEAAAKMAKMQDSLRATEKEMPEVADLMQRANYLGADMAFMQSAIGNASPVMDVMKIKGSEAMRAIAPMAVMMNQAGMEDGGSVGNAVRKIYDRAMNAKKVDKANEELKSAGAGFKLDFTDGKGEFGGMEKLFAQLDKLRTLSTVNRGMVINALWGDDAETTRVLTKWINDNLDGYRETVEKMTAQADLNQRVNAQLDTVAAKLEAAQGSKTNMLKELGATIEPELKALLDWLGRAANAVGKWARENPRLTKAIMLTVAAVAALLTVTGALVIGIVAVLGPLHIARFLFSRWLLNLAATRLAAGAAGASMGLFARMGTAAVRVFAGLGPVLLGLGRGIMMLGGLMMANPIFIALALIATAAFLIWRNWDGIKGGLMIIWQQLSDAVSAWWNKTAAGAQALWQDLVALKDRFFSAGADLMSGLMNGITSRLGAVRETIGGAADSVGTWFREKLGINSPSRVFMQYGGWISEGAALGIAGGQGAVRAAALAMAGAATLAMPTAANAALQMNTRPALGASAQAGQAGQGSATYNITIHAAPGMDTQALARAVSAELDRRERASRSRVLSQLGDID